MICIILAHGDLAEGLKSSYEAIMGSSEGLYAVGVYSNESIERLEKKLQEIILNHVNQKVYLLIDILGGTPFNLVSKVYNHSHVEIFTGVNLPMVIELMKFNEKDFIKKSRDSILDVRKLLRRETND